MAPRATICPGRTGASNTATGISSAATAWPHGRPPPGSSVGRRDAAIKRRPPGWAHGRRSCERRTNATVGHPPGTVAAAPGAGWQ